MDYQNSKVQQVFPIPQLSKSINSIRVMYFAVNGHGNAINALGKELPGAPGRVNTVENILGGSAVVLFDGFLTKSGSLIETPADRNEIALGEGVWPVTIDAILTKSETDYQPH